MLRGRPIYFFIGSLLLGLVSAGFEFLLDPTPDQLVERLSRNFSVAMEKLETERERIRSNPNSVVWSELSGSHFLVDSTGVLHWSRHEVVPDFQNFPKSSSVQLLQNAAGDFIITKEAISSTQVLYSVLTVNRKYPIVNKYLSSLPNKEIVGEIAVRIVPLGFPSGGQEILIDGIPVCKVILNPSQNISKVAAFVTGTISLLFLLLSVYFVLYKAHRERRFQTVFLVATLSFIVIRVSMVELNIPGRWIQLKIFSPQEFASSVYNASVGDMLFNASGILILCGYLFFTYFKWNLTRRILSQHGWLRWLLSSLMLLIAFFSFLYPFLFIETIFNNSAISLDVTQSLSFNWIRILAFVSLLIGTVSSFFFTHVFIRFSQILTTRFLEYAIALLLAMVLFIAYFLVESRDYWITLLVGMGYIVFQYFSGLTTSFNRVTYRTFFYLFLSLAAFSIQGALSIRRFVESEQVESQFRFATSYLIDRDVMAEYLLKENARRIANDAFIQTRLASPFLNKSSVREKIRQVYLNAYFDRYDVKVYLYTGQGQSLDNPNQPDFQFLQNEFTKTGNTTDYPNLFIIRAANNQISKRYYVMIPIARFDQVVAHIILDLSLKRIIPQNVYPELLVDNRFAEYFENRAKSFAFISGQKIISSFGNFNYDRDFDFHVLEDPEFYRQGIKSDTFIHAGIEDDSGRVAVVTALAYPWFYVFTNFSFFFVLGVLILSVFVGLYGIIAWLKDRRINYAARIQLYIYVAFAVPLIAVTITTLNRVSSSAEDQLKQEFQSRSRMVGENLAGLLTAFKSAPDSVRSVLEQEVVRVARFSNVDVTIYNDVGRMIVSSQPEIVESQLTSGWMDRQAWERIFQRGENAFVSNEEIGSLQFNNSYFGMKSPESGDLVGVLSVPFFESGLSLEATQITVLANILTVFTVIFILFSLLSFIVVDSLTFPLRFITRILSRTTLTGKNEPLDWKSNDEIGLMVSEYNKMLENLDRSKIELERSQKETAWREIAKQVAHEIKNPLTPMKLTLQQMEVSLLKKELDSAKAQQSVKTLLTQVEILNEIASSFSSFARMPSPILQKIELTALLRKAIDLYSNYESGKVIYADWEGPIFIMGDEQLLSRIFSNIILNGLQSGEGIVQVRVSLQIAVDSVLILFQDNGSGIDPELQTKIFAPYFSTKKSGSGLGLAIAKQGIEQSGGSIWFESGSDRGTTFYIRIPRVA